MDRDELNKTAPKVHVLTVPSLKGKSRLPTERDRSWEWRRRKALLVAVGLITLTFAEAYFAHYSNDASHDESTHQAERR